MLLRGNKLLYLDRNRSLTELSDKVLKVLPTNKGLYVLEDFERNNLKLSHLNFVADQFSFNDLSDLLDSKICGAFINANFLTNVTLTPNEKLYVVLPKSQGRGCDSGQKKLILID